MDRDRSGDQDTDRFNRTVLLNRTGLLNWLYRLYFPVLYFPVLYFQSFSFALLDRMCGVFTFL